MYYNEISKKEYSLENCYEYLKFTNSKITDMFRTIGDINKYRIILIGDHGYKLSKFIDPHYTLAAYYGFEETDVDRVESIQDIGSLIQGYFN